MGNTADVVKKISEVVDEPKCVLDHRLAMWDAYLKEPLPDRVLHLWKYSDPNKFILNGLNILNEIPKIEFIVDNALVSHGIILTDIKNIFKIESLRSVIKEKFGALLKNDLTKINYLNEATWSSGYFLYVPSGIKIETPVIVKNISSDSGFRSQRVLIILEKDSSLNLIEETTAEDEISGLNNIVHEIFLEDGSKLNYFNLQTNGQNITSHLFERALLNEHAEFTNVIVSVGGKTSKADLGVVLNGDYSKINTYGIVVGDKNQKFDYHTTIEHIKPFTKSEVQFRSALKDKAQSAYTGNLKIKKEAVKSDSYQENRSLILSRDAKAESIPELEILTNDVIRCSHGVTIGHVDKEQIYYLTSRGLSEKESEKMIVQGFLEPAISRIPLDSLKEKVSQVVEKKLDETETND